MKLTYENEIGRVVLRGGTDSVYNITEIGGLSIPETMVDFVRYPDTAGQTVTRISVLPRTITIAGDICDKTGKYTSHAAKVFSRGGTVHVTTNRSTRKINCRCVSFEPSKRRGTFVPFTMQLIADNPYFEDVVESKTYLAKKSKLLASSFSLPAIFSKRTGEAVVINRGDVFCEPVIEISALEEAKCPKGIVIQNRTTGASLKLTACVLAGECIKVDVENRKVSGSIQGNLIGCLASDTPMSKFLLAEGVNDLCVTAEDEEQTLFVVCRYRNKYAEAVL